jgi:hypothetical protein
MKLASEEGESKGTAEILPFPPLKKEAERGI